MPVTSALGSISCILSSRIEFEAILSYLRSIWKKLKTNSANQTRHWQHQASRVRLCVFHWCSRRNFVLLFDLYPSSLGQWRQYWEFSLELWASLPFSFLNSHFCFHHFIFGLPTSSFFTYMTFWLHWIQPDSTDYSCRSIFTLVTYVSPSIVKVTDFEG